MLYLRSFNRFILSSLVLLGLTISNQAQSAILSELDVTPSATSVGVGESFQIDVGVSGITDPGVAIAAYGVNIAYDASMFTLNNVTFGDELSYFDPPTAVVRTVVESPLSVTVAEDSLQFDASMAPLQPEAFTFFTLFFTALTPGVGIFGGPDAFVAFGGLAAEFPSVPTITVSVGVVPIPAAIWLFGTALIGLVGFSKRRKTA